MRNLLSFTLILALTSPVFAVVTSTSGNGSQKVNAANHPDTTLPPNDIGTDTMKDVNTESMRGPISSNVFTDHVVLDFKPGVTRLSDEQKSQLRTHVEMNKGNTTTAE